MRDNNYIYVYMLWFSVILGSIFIFLCFKLIIIHYHTQQQRKIQIEPRIKLNHNIYTSTSMQGHYQSQWLMNHVIKLMETIKSKILILTAVISSFLLMAKHFSRLSFALTTAF